MVSLTGSPVLDEFKDQAHLVPRSARVHFWRALGVLLILLGLATLGSALLSARGAWRLGVGEAWTLLGAALYALQIVEVARWAKQADLVALAGIQALVVALCTLPFAGDLGVALRALDPADWTRIGYLAVCGSVVAPLLQVRAQRALPAGRLRLRLSRRGRLVYEGETALAGLEQGRAP